MTGAIRSAGYPRGSPRTDNRRLGDQHRRNPKKNGPSMTSRYGDLPVCSGEAGAFARTPDISGCMCQVAPAFHSMVAWPSRPVQLPLGSCIGSSKWINTSQRTRRTKRSVQLSLPNALYIGPVTMPAKQRSACNFLKNVVTCAFFLDIAIFFVHETFLLTCQDFLIHARRRVAACFVFACGTHQRTGNICSAMHTACRSRSELVVSMATLVTPGCSSAKRSASSARLRRRP